MHLPHDPAFKRLLAHSELVRALLALVPDCPASVVAALERVNSSFISTSERQRYADMVWRVDCQQSSFYALIEFQASIDRQMDQRMKVYAGLLSQDLGAQHKRELLDLLPVVVYSGKKKWRRPGKRPADWLMQFQEGKMYFLIDEELAGDSVIGDVIRLVRGDSLAAITASVRALITWPQASDELRNDVCRIGNARAAAFGTNLEAIMEDETVTRKVPAELTDEEKRSVVEMYRLMYMTLKDTPEVKRIAATWDKARLVGAKEGRQEGLQEGRQEGRQEGLQEGRAEILRKLLFEAGGRAHNLLAAQERAIASAGAVQLEGWVRRVMAGEKLEEVLAEVGP